LASIIGSRFLVLAPLLDRSFGIAAGPAMLGLCGAAYLFGAAIRHNIPSRRSDAPPPALIRNLERLSSAALAIAYVISVTSGKQGLTQVSYHEAVALMFAGIRFKMHYKVGFISVSIRFHFMINFLAGQAFFHSIPSRW
jgi:hypothetical protein